VLDQQRLQRVLRRLRALDREDALDHVAGGNRICERLERIDRHVVPEVRVLRVKRTVVLARPRERLVDIGVFKVDVGSSRMACTSAPAVSNS